jgi:two-component system sensor histidine kinase/response regulator
MTPAKPVAATRPTKARSSRSKPRAHNAKVAHSDPIASAELAEAILGTMVEGVIVSGLDAQPIYQNQRATEMTGLTLEQRLALNADELAARMVRVDGTPQTPDTLPLRKTLRTGKPESATHGIRRPDGEIRWLEVTATPMRRNGTNDIFGACLVMRDVTQARAAEEALKSSEEMKGAVMAASVDAILMLDGDGRIVELNRSAERLYKTTRAAIGDKLETYIPWRDRQVWVEIFDRLRNDPKHFRGRRLTGTGRRSDGSEFPLEATIDSLHAAGHQMFVTFVRDVTERRAAERRLADARDAALRASVVKSEFLATMSHEIRTPMNGVIGSLDLILDSDLADEQRELATIARTSAHDLLAIIDDILDLSKIEADRLDSQTIEFDLAALVEGVTDIVAVPARRKGLALCCFVDPRTPSVLRGDARLLRQVLVNLIGNAVKFTDSGEVAIRAELQPADGSRVRVQLAVSDTGIGIPADALETLFEPFTQVDGSSTRAHGGTGLGLAISSRLVRLMGGDLVVDSGVGRGSTFSFTVPFEVPERATDPAFGPISQTGPLNVLIIEPVASTAETIDRYLRAWGITTTRSPSGPQALKLFDDALKHERPFDAVLVAVDPADEEPDEFARRLRERVGEDSVFVIALLDIGERLTEVTSQPFDAVVAKPIKQSRLYDALAGCDRAAVPEPPVEDALPESAELSGLRILIAEDNPVNQQVLMRQAGRLGLVVTAVENGAAALAALAEDTFDAVLMDCQMPVMDGYAAARAIRAGQGDAARIPIVAVTANAMREDYDRCRDAGMDEFVAKPVTLSSLAQAIARAVTVCQSPDGVAQDVLTDAIRAHDATRDDGFAIDRSTLAALQEDVGGAAALSRIIGLFLEQLDPQGAEIATAIKASDHGSVGRIAHRMKSSSATLGASALAEVLAEMEAAAGEGDAESLEKLGPALASAVVRVRSAFEGVVEGLAAAS